MIIMQLGAFYPFARDHTSKDTIHQELYIWDSVASSAKKALGLRYKLLPYFYMLMYEAHMKGTPIARPLFFSFPQDKNTYEISTQFLLGKGVMISPVLKPETVAVEAYFPAGKWYNLFNYSHCIHSTQGEYFMLDAPPDTINVHVREGNILVMHTKEALTTQAARKSSFQLLVIVSDNEKSTGELFLDDGEEVEMGIEGKKWTLVQFMSYKTKGRVVVESQVVNGEFASNEKLIIEKVTLLGLGDDATKFKSFEFTNIGSLRRYANGGRTNYKVSKNHGRVDISGLELLVGKEFRFEMKLNM